MPLQQNPVGRKMVVAFSGQLLLLFVVLHLAGNLGFFTGSMNVYAAGLHGLPFLLWPFRLLLVVFFGLHLFFAVTLHLENRRCPADAYVVKRHLAATFASKTMFFSGIFLAFFLVYHLLHWTIPVPGLGLYATAPVDAAGRPDVAAMLRRGLAPLVQRLFYLAATTALLLHLLHGIQSSLQSFGLGGDWSLPRTVMAGRVAAVLIFLGYLSIPLAIGLGFFPGTRP